MPNRMLRDWTNSDKVDIISFQAEVFFTRLIMKVDDYGCFWADAKRIKSHLFPLKSDSLRDADILRWMAECQKAGLIAVYESDDKKFLQIVDFGQRLRTKKSKFPLPNDSNMRTIDSNPPTNDGDLRPEENRSRIEDEGNNNNDIFFEMFRRVAGRHITDEELLTEVAKFKNKYPNAHANKSGALINTWVANIGREKQTEVKSGYSFL